MSLLTPIARCRCLCLIFQPNADVCFPARDLLDDPVALDYPHQRRNVLDGIRGQQDNVDAAYAGMALGDELFRRRYGGVAKGREIADGVRRWEAGIDDFSMNTS